MRNFTMVAPSIWSSERFLGLSLDTRSIYLYLLAGPHQTACGCYRITSGYASDDLRIEPNIFEKSLSDSVEAGLLHLDPTSSEIFIDNWFKHAGNMNNKNHIKHILRNINQLQSDLIKSIATEQLEAEKNQRNFEKNQGNLASPEASHPLTNTKYFNGKASRN